MTIFKAGTTAYVNAGTNVQTGSTNPAPPPGFSSYDYVEGAVLGFRQWTLPADAAWQFAELVWIDSVTGPTTGTAGPDLDFIALRNTNDTVNGLIVREQGRGYMRAVETGGTFPWTGAVQWPISAWYWVKGYGNASTNTGRIVLTDLTGAIVSGFDSGLITMAQGSTNPTSIRFGKQSATSTWVGRMAWCGMELRTGTDAAQALLTPTSTMPIFTSTVTPSDHTVGTLQTLTISHTAGTGAAITYGPGTWDGATLNAQTSTGTVTWTHTDSTAGTKNWTMPWSQA